MKSKVLAVSAISLATVAAARADTTLPDPVATITTALTSVTGIVATVIGIGLTVLTWRLVRKYVKA